MHTGPPPDWEGNFAAVVTLDETRVREHAKVIALDEKARLLAF
jgi:hypothetical protein